MKKFFWFCLFFIGLFWVLSSFKGLADQGEFQTIVLDFRENIPVTQIEASVRSLDQNYRVEPHPNSIFSGKDHIYIIKGDRQLLANLKKSDLAKYTEIIEPNYIYGVPEPNKPQAQLSTVSPSSSTNGAIGTVNGPNDPLYSKQWNLHNINIQSAWHETKGDGVTVAVIDTGVTQVPDLKETKIVPGYDFVNDQVSATDDNGHGTHVAGTIAQSTNNNYGVAGVAYEAKIMPLKVLSASGGGTIADIAEAIRFAADNGADVINLSLGGSGESQLMEEAINYAHQKGVVIIAAAGNSNQNAAGYPARYPRVLGVAALDAAGKKAVYSNFGAGVDLAAPGGDTSVSDAGGILQNTIDPAQGTAIFAAYQGTSMASPHVAGVAAMIKAVGVSDPNTVVDILKQSARTVVEDPLNHYGAGQLNAGDAVQLALRGKLTFTDFFRWLRDNGYLNPHFWIDGGAIALLPKIAMVLGSYLLAWFLRNYLPFSWSWSLVSGLVVGSSGLFPLRALYVFDLPQWSFRVMGSSIPELGTAIQGSHLLNPIFASILIPLLLVTLLLGHPSWKWFAIGSTLGVASCLAVSAVISPSLLWLGDDWLARIFLAVNALLCFALARLASKGEK